MWMCLSVWECKLMRLWVRIRLWVQMQEHVQVQVWKFMNAIINATINKLQAVWVRMRMRAQPELNRSERTHVRKREVTRFFEDKIKWQRRSWSRLIDSHVQSRLQYSICKTSMCRTRRGCKQPPWCRIVIYYWSTPGVRFKMVASEVTSTRPVIGCEINPEVLKQKCSSSHEVYIPVLYKALWPPRRV